MERHCSQFLQEVEDGRVIGIVSTFVSTEYQAVAKRLMASASGRAPTDAEMMGFMQDLQTLLADLGVEIHSADGAAVDSAGNSVLFGSADHVLRLAGVEAVHRRRGRRRWIDWKSVGGADGLHVAIAQRVGATHIATCDKAFRRLRGPITSLVLEDEYP